MLNFRLVMTLVAACVLTAGFAAAAWSMTRGQVEQAIAFGWPALSIAVAIAVALPPRSGQARKRRDAEAAG